MPNPMLKLISEKKPLIEIQKYSQTHREKLPLFVKLAELNNKTVYQYIKKYKKLHNLSLCELIKHKLIDFNEMNDEENNLMACLVNDDELLCFQQLLLCGEKPNEQIFTDSEEGTIGNFLRYRPGRDSLSVYELVNKRVADLARLSDFIFDFADTTDEESSEAELSDTEELDTEEKTTYEKLRTKLLKKYNATGDGEESLVLVAARGVHFVPKHFPKQTRDTVFESRKNAHTTYSFSTLIDAGYEAGDEPDEDDDEITAIHERNKQFIAGLKATPDKKEKTTAGHPPPAARNKKVFTNLFWRETQAYINSYSVLFNKKGIQTNFAFASPNNPHLSLSWKTEIAGMYSSGVRFGWKRGERRDPHYRRSTGKPKHPTVGYIDVFELPLDYVRSEGVDRILAYNAHKIDLSNIHLAEAEVIFHSMISKEYHVRRYMVVMPSFSKVTSQAEHDEKYFGIQNAGAYTRARNSLFKSIGGMAKGDSYHKWVTLRAEHAVAAQARLIDNATDVRLFRSGKVRVYDHGEDQAVSAKLPVANR